MHSNNQPPCFTWVSLHEWEKDSHWWSIYVKSFPERERDTKNQLTRALKNQWASVGRFRCAGQTIAIAVVYPLKTLPITFLHYFAVAPLLRGQNLGSTLLRSLIVDAHEFNYQHHRESMGLVFEVEDPHYATNEHDRTVRNQRIQFYEKNKAQLLKNTFIQPPINAREEKITEKNGSLHMRLMYASLQEEMLLFKQEEALARAIYFEKYHVVNDIPAEMLTDFLSSFFAYDKKQE
ncbi:MAG: hypothetical protein A3E83_04700 [Gammaproteobacteria bacterium RIFCSPHIGHO2_12_FULL_41_20]|nr:MAG: hypothetical protein A3E83_04700 [Gammaproteobacteria bacterium RIFCSPHIGHO2_12_FULL_41_20]